LIRTIAVGMNGQLTTNLPVEKLTSPDILWYWVDFYSPTEEETKILSSHFKFHPLAIEDCFQFLQRPKLDYYEGYRFFVVDGLNPITLRSEEVDVFLATNYLVTFHTKKLAELETTWERVVNGENPEGLEPVKVFHLLLDKIVDNYFPILYKIEDRLDQIQQLEQRSNRALMNEVFDIRRDLHRLRKSVFPMRDLLYRILNSERIEIPKEQKMYFADIYDHLLKLAEMVESNRDVTSDIRDSYISLNSNRMNNIMMTLTIISAIFIPLTFIAGVYGMNFVNMPELTWHYGYYIVLLFMAGIGISMFWWFKKKGWLGDD